MKATISGTQALHAWIHEHTSAHAARCSQPLPLTSSLPAQELRLKLIRPATLKDLAAVKRIAAAAYSKYVPRIGKKPAPMVADFASQIGAGMVYVDCEQQQVQAFVVFYPRGDHVHLENLAVAPDSQQRGAGKRLALFVEEAAKQKGFDAVELYTNAECRKILAFISASAI